MEEEKYRIALIGNMNNNFFSLMRYFRDLGHDAVLFLYREDGTGANKHFIPENDSWSYNKWRPYIIHTRITNGKFHRLLNIFIHRRKYKKYFESFDFILGCGFSPGLCNILNKKLDLFLPYSFAGEYTGKNYKTDSYLRNLKYRSVNKIQITGLRKNTRYIGILDFSEENLINYRRNGLMDKIISTSIPMVYLENDLRSGKIENDNILKVKEIFKNHYPVILSHVAHVKYLLGWHLKRNDLLIKGFAEFVKEQESSALLVLLDYGDGVPDSKKLIKELEIENSVIWLPKMPRKNLLNIIKNIDLGCGELGGATWGGTGWEFLACGKPFIQNIGMTEDEFIKKTGIPLPDIFLAKTEFDVKNILQSVSENKALLDQKSSNIKTWFENYSGKNCARKIIDILTGV